MSGFPDALTSGPALEEWLSGPFGRLLIEAERQQLAAALEDVFGVHCIQIGHWGPPDSFCHSPGHRAGASSPSPAPAATA